MAPISNFDPHARPPDSIKNLYKKYQKIQAGNLAFDQDLLDLQTDSRQSGKLTIVGQLESKSLNKIFDVFESPSGLETDSSTLLKRSLDAVPIYEHSAIPGNSSCIINLLLLPVLIFSIFLPNLSIGLTIKPISMPSDQ
jgi:hypothetical protein